MIGYQGHPQISVVVSEYDPDETERLEDCIESVLSQEYEGESEVIVISESTGVSDYMNESFGNNPAVEVVEIQNNQGGLSVARNKAVEHASGDIIAYIDSDARANEGWMDSIGQSYRNNNILATGGEATPNWKSDRPAYLPDEFLWLVGCSYEGHPEDGSILRNGIGCNMSYKRDVLEEIKFSENLGKDHGYNLQGEEPELGIKMQKKFNSGVYYVESAGIEHDVDEVQTEFKWLTRRAYLQGVSKSIINDITGDESLQTDKSYLGMIVSETIPKYAKGIIKGPRKHSLANLFGTICFTTLVGIGYIIATLKLKTGRLQ